MSQLNVPVSLRVVRDNLAKMLDVSWFDVGLKTGLVVLYATILYLAWTTGALLDPFAEVYKYRIGGWLMTLGAGYSALMLMVTLVRVIMVMGYRPMKRWRMRSCRSVTVIIPAYNEGPDVAKSIESMVRSDYPRGKMQIIAIDDGSKDDTWVHMEAAARRHPDIVCAIRMEKNGGKRQGLRVGFALAAGDVLVTMDSDSVVEREALRKLVTPIAADPRIGAVAGNVKVLNRIGGDFAADDAGEFCDGV